MFENQIFVEYWEGPVGRQAECQKTKNFFFFHRIYGEEGGVGGGALQYFITIFDTAVAQHGRVLRGLPWQVI